ncbi:putative c6 transcription factor protein [Phaeoacremonium minimum UCRPA7]|uniref:Putative c6 transcription factor protein n=1 Tax=Phaeoacremonium minimum (strain UCR-PA7) TaxID=1286976 RepID=R8BL83_PHAM7|nr:putative c6 transcription factor protein [Phaeoacremonium minimum UCRPA7]EOO00020.1 putative c6 transcription factor protein [Phaeoacremonium minimum UCRPA7]
MKPAITPHNPEHPSLIGEYEYLMHAILGLAASELIDDDPSLVTAAMTHRLKAIKAIKKTLADASRANTFEEGNALMATCFALTFQSVILDDGMAEYMTFIRGIMIVATQMYQKGAKFLFTNWIGEDQKALMKPKLEKIPLVNRDWVDSAATAVQSLGPICTEPVAKKYHELLLVMITQLYQSSFGAYKSISDHYGWWMMLPYDDFQRVIDTHNPVMVLLASHWIAIKQIMATITETEHEFGKRPNQDRGIDLGIISTKMIR